MSFVCARATEGNETPHHSHLIRDYSSEVEGQQREQYFGVLGQKNKNSNDVLRCKAADWPSDTPDFLSRDETLSSLFFKLTISPSLAFICIYDYFGPTPDVLTRFVTPMYWQFSIEREQAYRPCLAAQFTRLNKHGERSVIPAFPGYFLIRKYMYLKGVFRQLKAQAHSVIFGSCSCWQKICAAKVPPWAKSSRTQSLVVVLPLRLIYVKEANI